MSELERLIKKHITLLARQGTQSPTSLSCNCCIDGTTQLDVNKICTAVKQLSGSVGNPGSNKCAKDILTNNTSPCEEKKVTRGSDIIRKCESYVRSVVALLPQGSTQQQIQEASTKAECDCLKNAVYGTPDINNLGFSQAVMGQQVFDFYREGCSYSWISTVCGEREKVLARMRAPHLLC
jgi:hypothetical protein